MTWGIGWAVQGAGKPEDSENVITYHLPGKNPATASNNQFDYAFALRGFHQSLKVRALNEINEWDPRA